MFMSAVTTPSAAWCAAKTGAWRSRNCSRVRGCATASATSASSGKSCRPPRAFISAPNPRCTSCPTTTRRRNAGRWRKTCAVFIPSATSCTCVCTARACAASSTAVSNSCPVAKCSPTRPCPDWCRMPTGSCWSATRGSTAPTPPASACCPDRPAVCSPANAATWCRPWATAAWSSARTTASSIVSAPSSTCANASTWAPSASRPWGWTARAGFGRRPKANWCGCRCPRPGPSWAKCRGWRATRTISSGTKAPCGWPAAAASRA